MTHHTVSKARDERAERAVLGSWLGAALGVAGVLVPKCPLCVAAYLCLFGVSAGSAQAIAQLGVPLCVALMLASLLGTALLVVRRGRRSTPRGSSTWSGALGGAGDACCCGSRRAPDEALFYGRSRLGRSSTPKAAPTSVAARDHQ